jgi:hypothetical protein
MANFVEGWKVKKFVEGWKMKRFVEGVFAVN